mgnify:CR=1 FL=1
MKVDKIIIHGEVFCGGSGYENHIIQFSKALNKIIPVQINCQRPVDFDRLEDKELKEMIQRNFDVEDSVNVMIGLPSYWEFLLSMNPMKFIGCVIWEATPFPKRWVNICNDERVNQLWTPSTFVKNIMIESGVDEKKIYVIPHGVNLSVFRAAEKIDE